MKGCWPLQGAVAELGCELESLMACHNGAVVVSRNPKYWPIRVNTWTNRTRSSSALARVSASPNRARYRPCSPSPAQRASQREAELDGQHPGIAVLGKVREGLEGLLEAATASRDAARS